ncbi:hypothetical protein [Faunimonas pinastri]|nr:hypothetical protein [Faunimonas pinastri]
MALLAVNEALVSRLQESRGAEARKRMQKLETVRSNLAGSDVSNDP